MNVVTSADGTKIAYDRQGAGPPLIIVDGALCARGSKESLADLLAPHFTVYRYDRRGRGDSGDSPDTRRDAPSREVEDLAALIKEAGGTGYLYGHSSGAALALEATLRLDGAVRKLAMYEVPYNDDPASHEGARRYIAELGETLADGRPGDAVALFMAYVGMPAEQVAGMRQSPGWAAFEAIGPTLAYDHIGLLGEHFEVPAGKAARVAVPTLLIYGEAGAPYMAETARTLSQAIPGARLRGLAGQTHDVDPQPLAPVLTEFFAA
jgi:pimeloyl-ACP methyl ester carboxylesterase